MYFSLIREKVPNLFFCYVARNMRAFVMLHLLDHFIIDIDYGEQSEYIFRLVLKVVEKYAIFAIGFANLDP